jgi:hypothetical protein
VKRTTRAAALAACIAALANATPAHAVDVGASAALQGEHRGSDEDEFRLRSQVVLQVGAEIGAGVSAEARLSLGLLYPWGGDPSVADEASHAGVRWRGGDWGEQEGLALRLYPLQANRLHLGHELPTGWGWTPWGTEKEKPAIDPSARLGSYRESSPRGVAPGIEARLIRERWYLFASAKSGRREYEGQPSLALAESADDWLFAWMVGGGVDVLEVLRLELGGGLADQGQIASTGVRASSKALTSRLLFHRGDSIGRSVDLSFYSDEPGLFESMLSPESYPGGISTTVSLEGTRLDFKGTRGGVTQLSDEVSETSAAVALQARLKVDFLRVHLLGLVQGPWFGDSLNTEPLSFLGMEDIEPALLVAGGADYHFAALGLTPGVVVRAEWPAALAVGPPMGWDNPPESLSSERTVIFRGAEPTLIPGERGPILTAKATLRWDFDDRLCVIGETWWMRDPNRGSFVSSSASVAVLVASTDNTLGAAVLVQGGF